MKKLFVAVALVMGVGTSVAFAGNMSTNVYAVASINEFKPVDVKDLPQVVQDAIKKDYADLLVKEAAVEEDEEGGKTYKVVLVNQDNEESTVYYNENGEELK
ncbi:hypothetical protein [Phocaeicola barnesiae]